MNTEEDEFKRIEAEAKRRSLQAAGTHPAPCPTCEALARTVMLDQTSHDTQRQWVGLTDEEITQIYEMGLGVLASIETALDKIEERNT